MATVTFTLTAGEVTRLQAAVGKVQNLGQAATPEQARQFIIAKIKAFVLETEREDYLALHTTTPFDPI